MGMPQHHPDLVAAGMPPFGCTPEEFARWSDNLDPETASALDELTAAFDALDQERAAAPTRVEARPALGRRRLLGRHRS